MDFSRGYFLCAARAALSLAACALLALAAAADEPKVSFNRDIRPFLADRCYHCHGQDEESRQADMRLDLEEESRYVIEPGDPENSELLRRVTSDDPDEVMPPPDSHKQALTEDEIAMLRRWIEQGAEYEEHWAFVTPERPDFDSEANGAARVAAAIDHFAARRRSERELAPAKPAAPGKWLRRMTLDLTGLPPTIDEIQRFEQQVAERGDAAYTEAADLVLASPRYGERMALDWLDVARYADTHGFQHDAFRMNWPWRDWVIDAFNNNMPFDQFTIEQLAGDLLDGPDGTGPTNDQMVATAFNRNHMINGEGGAIRAENLAKTAFDRLETTSTAWLGLTMNCCQCHDHKFDPLKQRDYYQFYAFFNQVDEKAGMDKQFYGVPAGRKQGVSFMVDRPYISLANDEQQERLKQLKEARQQADKDLEAERPNFEPEFIQWIEEMRADQSLVKKRVTVDYLRRSVNTISFKNRRDSNTRNLTLDFLKQTERWGPLVKALKDAERAERQYQVNVPLVMVMRDNKQRDTFILERGNYESPGERVSAGVPEFLPPLPEGQEANRRGFAEWLVSDEHPLMSRVTVNRLWQLLFGRGIVATPDDFGLQGALPTHPELLDWLAVEFRESGWDVKHILKGMVLSQPYRQTSEVSPDAIASDPDNRWLTRGPRRRLDSRLLRDQALALSGLLVDERGGPPVFPYQPPGIWEEMSLGKNKYEQDHGDALYRRSLYTVWRRVVAPAHFFDVPSRQTCSVKPQLTSTPLHALTMLNDKTYIEAARVWAGRLIGSMTNENVGDEARLTEAFFAATARQPGARELETLAGALADARQHFADAEAEAAEFVSTGEYESARDLDPVEHAAWTTVCLLLLNLDETLCK